MSNIAANSKEFIGKMRGLLDSFGVDSPAASALGLPESVTKAITDRYTFTWYFSVSEDSKNITILDEELPTDAISSTHAFVDRYAVLVYRSQTSSTVKDSITILDEGTTTDEAQNYALGLVENNRNNIYNVQVLVGVPWTYAGRPIFRRIVTFYLVSRSADIDQKSGVPILEMEKRRAANSQGQHHEQQKNGNGSVKKGFTVDKWEDPSDDLSIKKLAECVPAAIKSWGVRLARATDGKIPREALIFPYKTADGIINLNAVRDILNKVDNANVPVSVRKAVKAELTNHLTKSRKDITRSVSFIKSADALARGLLYGVVYEPLVKDAHEDFATVEEIENAAHNYLPKAMLNVEHDELQTLENSDSLVVESYIAPCDFKLDDDVVTKGSWVLVTKLLTEELIQKVRNGEITGYSLEGSALKLD